MQILYLDVSDGESLILALGRKAQVLLHYFFTSSLQLSHGLERITWLKIITINKQMFKYSNKDYPKYTPETFE